MDEVGTLALAGGIPNLAETIDLLAGGHALLGWKKNMHLPTHMLNKSCWYLGWIHKSMYMEQSYASLGWGMFNQKTYFGPSLLSWDLAFVAPNQLALAGSNIFLGLVRTCCNNINRGLNWASCLVPTRFLLQPLIFLETTHALAAEPCLFLQSFGGVQQGDLARHSRVAWEIRAVARSLMCSRDSKETHYFTSSDPHCDRLCCHSFWHLMWKHTFWHSSLAFYLTFNSDILYWHSILLLGIHSDVLFWHSIQHLFWHSLWHWALPDLRERQIPVLTYQSNIPMAAASTAPEVPEFRGIAWGWLHLPLRDTRVGSVLYNPYRTHIITNINNDISCILNTHTHTYIYIYIYIYHIYIIVFSHPCTKWDAPPSNHTQHAM